MPGSITPRGMGMAPKVDAPELQDRCDRYKSERELSWICNWSAQLE